jgi:hypothetical protein
MDVKYPEIVFLKIEMQSLNIKDGSSSDVRRNMKIK